MPQPSHSLWEAIATQRAPGHAGASTAGSLTVPGDRHRYDSRRLGRMPSRGPLTRQAELGSGESAVGVACEAADGQEEEGDDADGGDHDVLVEEDRHNACGLQVPYWRVENLRRLCRRIVG